MEKLHFFCSFALTSNELLFYFNFFFQLCLFRAVLLCWVRGFLVQEQVCEIAFNKVT